MTQRAVSPHEQSLCFTEHARQDQCSHQIHLRWFTSSTNRATIQSRIWLRDTQPRYARIAAAAMGRSAYLGSVASYPERVRAALGGAAPPERVRRRIVSSV